MERPISELNTFEWHTMVQEAALELDPEKLRAKIAEAETMIFCRLQSIGEDGSSSAERSALHEASNTLLTLKKEVLKFPDWKP